MTQKEIKERNKLLKKLHLQKLTSMKDFRRLRILDAKHSAETQNVKDFE